MNNILKNTIGLAVMTVLTMGMASCSLDEDTTAISTQDKFFRNRAECQSVVNGCYIPLKSIYRYEYFLAVECVSDVMWCESSTLDASADISPVKPRFGTTVWEQGYLGVQRCNFAVAGIEKCENLSDEDRNALLCEVKTLRAFYYWHLTSFFGNVPFYLYDVTNTEVLLKVAQLPRMDAKASRTELINDLKSVAALVPQTRTSDDKNNRFGAAAAWMMIAELAAWNQEWEEVISAVSKLESIYRDLNQYPISDIPFRYKNTPESIIEIQHAYEEGGLEYTSNVACVTTPKRKDNTDIYDGVQIKELGAEATVWQSARPTFNMCIGLTSKKSKDERTKINLAWEYTNPETQEVLGFANVPGCPWLGPKFWCPGMRQSKDSNNYKVFRYANALLLKAEAYCELNELGLSKEYLDMTRTRANLEPYTLRTQARLRSEIRNERARELYGEFQRKFDLVRWGIWYDAVRDYSNYDTLVDRIQPCHEYYPIPDLQVVYSKYNLDNKEYARYGM